MIERALRNRPVERPDGQGARDVCTYIYETHGRFPAHCDTLHVPGVWLQAHHVEEGYYQEFFRNGLTEEHQLHDQRWHPAG